MTRTVVITGASTGIGAATALWFGAQGDCVVVAHNGDPEGAEATAERIFATGGSSLIVDVDLRKLKSIQAMVKRVLSERDHVNVLVNNAAICPFHEFLEISIDEWDEVLAVNLRGVFILTQLVIPGMLAASTAGRIINVSSTSSIVGTRDQAHYGAAKAALGALTRTLAVSFANAGLTANVVLPGPILTNMSRSNIEAQGPNLLSRIPVGRVGYPDEVASLIGYLASTDAAFINGSEVVIDGGISINAIG